MPTNHTAEGMIEAAHALGPMIASMRDQIEQERRVPSQPLQVYGANFETGGRVLLGMEPGTLIL